jgi:nucleoid-associated protein YgaU
VHVAREGDSLAGLAFKEYGDPGLWRVIAEVNRIDDPMRMHAGARLLLPSPKELDSLIQRPARLDAVAVPEAARA